MSRFSSHLFKVLAASPGHQFGGRYGGKAIGGTGTAQEAVIERAFDFIGPVQTLFNDSPEQGKTSPGYSRFMTGATEDRAGHLAKPAAVALGDIVVVLLNVGQRDGLQQK